MRWIRALQHSRYVVYAIPARMVASPFPNHPLSHKYTLNYTRNYTHLHAHARTYTHMHALTRTCTHLHAPLSDGRSTSTISIPR